ncbi:potassium channel family protein [Baaleninema simplex]|uniref:potassium channel family protein n=1 Tax=Baaleninema simplex TaxID=2862350 RepID=UPI0008FBDC20|nr:potassium channel family protein [Baaleninema simplex]
MPNHAWTKLHHRHYTNLFAAVVILFSLSPFLSDWFFGQIVRSALFFIALAAGIRPFCHQRRFFRLMVLLSTGFSLELLTLLPFLSDRASALSLGSVGVFAAFTLLAIGLISNQLFTDREVTKDTIMGGICVYFLLGLLWGLLYIIAKHFDPQAFNQPDPDLIYFSFTTLTTLGYGDISPTSDLTQVLSNLEAIVGQMYPAVYLARLVSLYVSPEKL